MTTVQHAAEKKIPVLGMPKFGQRIRGTEKTRKMENEQPGCFQSPLVFFLSAPGLLHLVAGMGIPEVILPE